MELDVNCTKTRKIIDFRKNGYDDLIVLGKYNYNRTEGNLADHVHHNMIEICYYDKGSQWFCVNDKRYLVKGGDVFIHFPGELHGSGGYPEEKGLLYWLIICLPPALSFSDGNDASDENSRQSNPSRQGFAADRNLCGVWMPDGRGDARSRHRPRRRMARADAAA